MSWFIFSEVMFFAAFFGALFYARMVSVPWLAGGSNNEMTHALLWPGFEAIWPLIMTPDGKETQAMPWTGLPLYNTILLLISSITLHFAHVALEKNKRTPLKLWLGATILFGIAFLTLQVEEYVHAYQVMGLTLDAGVYGNTFFLLTGFHGMHVTLGTVFLIILFVRVLKGHFSLSSTLPFKRVVGIGTLWMWYGSAYLSSFMYFSRDEH